jgi:hypothetical protein
MDNNIFVHLHQFKNRGKFQVGEECINDSYCPLAKLKKSSTKKFAAETRLGEKEANLQSQFKPSIYP